MILEKLSVFLEDDISNDVRVEIQESPSGHMGVTIHPSDINQSAVTFNVKPGHLLELAQALAKAYDLI